MTDTWHTIIGAEKEKAYFQSALQQVAAERNNGITIFPEKNDVFNAFRYTSFEDLKVVILGQDPYHDDKQAHGLAFSVQQGVAIPPSLANIFKELSNDIKGFTIPQSGCLTSWAEQGVLLLNATLTVRAHQANSHQNIGWQTFTDVVIRQISQHKKHIVFLLWGAFAGQKEALIDKSKHLILKAPHPSPLSAHRGFFGCKHFSKANDSLIAHHQQPIDWRL